MAAPDYFQRKPSYHRARSGLGGAGLLTPTPGSPHTPLLSRSLSSQLGSPGSYRVEEESLVYEIGSRSFRAGFAGDSAPRCIIPFSPDNSRRVHDFAPSPPSPSAESQWGKGWELWDLDVRNVDLGLVEDKLERAVREAHTHYLVLDQRARRVVLVLPPTLPHPLISTILTVIFNSFQPASVQLWGTPVLCAVSAGLRSALVIDVGWHETTVTALYEYREVAHRRSTRASKMLTRRMADTLRRHTSEPIYFDSAEDIASRTAWCRAASHQTAEDDTPVSLPVGQVPFRDLSEPVEQTFLAEQSDDHDLPIHVLAYRCLLALPLDIRAICISRIVMTGGASNIPGLQSRMLRELEELVRTKAWDPVMNYGSAGEKRQQAAERHMTIPTREKPPDSIHDVPLQNGTSSPEETQVAARDAPQERDDISNRLLREAKKRGTVMQGVVRGVETMGAWAGASLAASLKVDAAFEIKRDDFLRNGLTPLGSNF